MIDRDRILLRFDKYPYDFIHEVLRQRFTKLPHRDH